ncbi:hypothetical protein SGFS_023710 [Streptomyces graminofaciens]|uniref:HTH lacI-type domain-containing protein n=1 Tax=Streptomyces graminofaciens TaxID=68212 RepID=A0ABM7F5K1_9ACTN|nr:LacI family DNA-binding transcriptional regulator [Streptomyces graminofaciens]BBC31077.1 hypothetical protein SGFS_023710 [Streptomyces graminofaciens]
MARVVGRRAGVSVPRGEDVARVAAVSRKTVSRLLDNEPYVSDEVRRRVFDAAEELGYRLDPGHTTVHHVAGPGRWYASKDRTEGWRAPLAAREAYEPPVIEGDWSLDSGYEAGRRLAADTSVTAVFAAGDEMAVGLIHALREAGRRVPEDISVVGFDGDPVFAHVTPPLTTVRQPFDAAAREGIKLLVHAIEGPQTEQPAASEPLVELVVRGSTAPPPTPHGRTVPPAV